MHKLKTTKYRYEKLEEEEEDPRSIEEIQASLAAVSKRLQKNMELLEELEGEQEDEESPYTACNDVGDTYSFDALPVALSYRDRNGKLSSRKVNLSSFDGYYLGGYCHKRKAYRTFVLERVLSFADGTTGEIISDPCTFLAEEYRKTPSFALDSIFDKYRNVLRVLYYVVKVDGRYTQHEKVLVRDLVRSLNHTSIVLNDNSIDKLMKDIEIPSLHSFKIAAGRVIKAKSLPFDLVTEVEKIIQSDGKIHALEEEALNYIKQRIKKEGQ